jgi:hypothetical protein
MLARVFETITATTHGRAAVLTINRKALARMPQSAAPASPAAAQKPSPLAPTSKSSRS